MLIKCFIFTFYLGLTFGLLTDEELDIFTSYGINVTEHSGDFWLMEHSGIPNHEIGAFPGEGNPNTVAEQNHDYFIPRNPIWLETPGCLPMGVIAMSKSGVPFYNPYSGEGLNAVGNEVFDDCHGHPDPSSTYHYHQIPPCLYEGGNNELMGVALDGYPILGPKDENGDTLTTADLDFCHGRMYNGRYQYHITYDFPYIMACYRGQSSRNASMMGPPGGMGPPDGMRPPPREGGNMGDGSPPPGGMMNWEVCYAYCENPATNDETGCVEPEYSENEQGWDQDDDSSGTGSIRLLLSVILMCVVFFFVQ